MSPLLLILLAWLVGIPVTVVVLAAIGRAYGVLLDRRVKRAGAAVKAAADKGHAEGEAAAFAGQWVEVSDLPLVPFRPDWPAGRRRDAIKTNCERARESAFLRGHAACTRAKLDAELGAAAAEGFDEDLDRIEAYANGEHRR